MGLFLWSDFLRSLEPILAQSTDVATPPPLSFSEISPADFLFLAEKGLAGGSPTIKAVEAARLWSAKPTRLRIVVL